MRRLDWKATCLNVKVKMDVYKKLLELAHNEERSLSQTIRKIIDEYLEKEK